MKVIIPVAGFGKRLRPHTLSNPKVLLNVAGDPMIFYIVDQLIKDRIASSIIFITGFLGNRIEDYINETFKFKFEFVVQEEAHGLGHAIYCAKKKFSPDKKEDVLIILGDTLFDVDLKKMCDNKYSVIGVKKVDDPRRFGVVEKDNNGFINKFIEKPASPKVSPSNEAIVGLYYLKDSKLLFDSLEYIIENNIKSKGEFQLTDALEKMINENGKMKTFNVNGWLDCGKPETILETNRYILQKRNKKYKIKSCLINDPVYIGKNVALENCIIGPHATINDNCVLKNCNISNSIISEDCVIENSTLTESLIGKSSKVKNKIDVLNLGEYSEI
ncbi:MAG: nucleotidyl transferase [Ignavibacteria bacterium]|nr:nucleotidyl transferase [Ignavibacteria bacterium]